MSKTYTLTSSASKGGLSSQWTDGVWSNYYFDNNSGETRRCGQIYAGGAYCATYYMFDSATLALLKTKTVTSVKLTITVTGGTGIPGSGTDYYVVREKANNSVGSSSSGPAWVGGNSILGYVRRESGSSSTFDLALSNTIPTYGYVLGTYSPGYGQFLYLSSTATLTVVTNENEYSYTLAYNANGGSGAPSSQTGSNTGTSPSYTFTIPNTSPTRTGYTFLGWSTSSSSTSASYSPGGSITVTASGTTTLYAVWKKNTYTVSYNANGGTGAPVSQTKTYGQTLTLSATKPTRENASAGSYTVTYNTNGGSVSPAFATAARTNSYSFKNWNTASGGGGTSYNPGGSYTANEAATMYAQWNVTASTAAVQLPTPTRTGYNFNGWYTAATGGAKVGDGGASYTPTGNVILYAQWSTTVVAPTFTTQPSSRSIYRGASSSLSAVATTIQGTISYRWQSSPNNSTWTDISGATSTTYSVPTATVGTMYYRCVATATKDGLSASANSNSCSVAVMGTPAPTITVQPENRTVFVGDTATFTVVAAGNALSYQWQYKRPGESEWNNAIVSGTNSSYNQLAETRHNGYSWRCIVTNTLNGYSETSISSVALMYVEEVSTPIFTKNPQNASYAYGSSASAITVLATSNGAITYQWEGSTDNINWNVISGATLTSYIPATTPVGTKYYRCKATATGGSESKSAYSTTATVNIVSASAPVFIYDLSTIDVTYNAGDVAGSINGSVTVSAGTVSYQWYKSSDSGSTWYPIQGAQSATYQPPTTEGGTAYYRVVATNTVGTSTASATSGSAKVTIQNVILTYDEKWAQYIKSVGKPFIKLARLDFLNPNGSVLFSLDNNPNNSRSKAFIQSGELSVNLQNGPRRTATVTLSNIDGEFDYNVNKLWFGQQVRLWEGIILPNGSDFYISQGVFYVKDPDEVFDPGLKQTTLNLVDKWAYLDGTLFGNLDGTYEVPLNSNIFNAIQSVLDMDRGNGQKIDVAKPVFTSYYNGKTTTLPDGTTVPLTNTPYTYRCDGENGTYADIILELNTMLAGWIGYDANGQLRLDPSQDDIIDATKPVQWQFSPDNSTFLGATYCVKNSEVYNDIIVVGESLSEYGQTAGRATNYDPKSDTNANIIGLKTVRYQQSGYYTQDICESLAVFKLKRETVLKKSVSIKCAQMFHLQENNLVTIERTDKDGAPIERHLITGYTRPIAQPGEMVLNCCSVQDYPTATITTLS